MCIHMRHRVEEKDIESQRSHIRNETFLNKGGEIGIRRSWKEE